MAPSAYFNTLSNIVFQNKKGIFLRIRNSYEECSFKVFSSSNSIRNLFCTSLQEWVKHIKHVKRISKCFGYFSHTDVIKQQTPSDSVIIAFIKKIHVYPNSFFLALLDYRITCL